MKIIARIAVSLAVALALVAAPGVTSAALLGYWPLDETSGTNAPNLAPGGTHGTLNNMDNSDWVAGKFGNALAFDGGNDFVSAGTIPAIGQNDSFTWSMWTYQQQGQNNDVILGNRYGGSSGWVKFTANAFEYRTAAGGDINYPDIPQNQWVHHAVVKDGNTFSYYRDGLPTGQTSTTTGDGGSQPFFLGGDSAGERWQGRLDDVGIWDEALTASQISTIHAGGIAASLAPVQHEVGGDNTIGTETLTGTQGNEVYGGSPTGRFLQVKNNGTANRRMDIGEIEAFAVGDTPTVEHAGDNQPLNPAIDLAYTGSTAGASVYAKGADSGFSQPHGTDDDGRLIDARETDGAGVWSSNGVGNFVTVDLGGTFEIGAVRVHQRNGCCQDRLRDFSVNIFADDGTGNPGALAGSGSYPGQPPNERYGEVSLASLVSADLVAELRPHDFGTGYAYVFELGSADMIEVDNPDPTVFTTILDINDADIVVEALGPLAPGEVFQLLSADQLAGQYNSLTLPQGVMEYGDFNETGAVTTGIIPEPITMLALGLGLTGLGGYTRRRRRA